MAQLFLDVKRSGANLRTDDDKVLNYILDQTDVVRELKARRWKLSVLAVEFTAIAFVLLVIAKEDLKYVIMFMLIVVFGELAAAQLDVHLTAKALEKDIRNWLDSPARKKWEKS